MSEGLEETALGAVKITQPNLSIGVFIYFL